MIKQDEQKNLGGKQDVNTQQEDNRRQGIDQQKDASRRPDMDRQQYDSQRQDDSRRQDRDLKKDDDGQRDFSGQRSDDNSKLAGPRGSTAAAYETGRQNQAKSEGVLSKDTDRSQRQGEASPDSGRRSTLEDERDPSDIEEKRSADPDAKRFSR